MKKWVCQKNRTHIFDDTSTYYCTICPRFEGILKEEEVDESGQSLAKEAPAVVAPPLVVEEEVGLSVILMDASDSMRDPAFKGIPLSRMTLVANSAASGIFDLQRMQNNPNAYVAGFKFDDRVELMFVSTVADLIKKYNNIDTFAAYLYEELSAMGRGTDINKALQQAYTFVDQFLNHKLDAFPVKNYTPMLQRIFRYNSVESVSIPNVRVLMYTDGMQYVDKGSKELQPNPFRKSPLPGLNHDILIGAYFGAGTDKGATDLRGLVSNCPIHNQPQFFLFDDASNIGTLKFLFRMASGASGFCPRCLEKQLRK